MGRFKGKKKRKLSPEDYFIQIYKTFLDEPAWLALSCGARCLYILLKSYFNGRNNGKLFFSVRLAAQRVGCSPSSAHKWFKELEEKGFVRKATPGSLGIDGHGLATCWILTELGYMGIQPTCDFKNWKPEN